MVQALFWRNSYGSSILSRGNNSIQECNIKVSILISKIKCRSSIPLTLVLFVWNSYKYKYKYKYWISNTKRKILTVNKKVWHNTKMTKNVKFVKCHIKCHKKCHIKFCALKMKEWMNERLNAQRDVKRKAELERLSVPLLKGKFLVRIQMFSTTYLYQNFLKKREHCKEILAKA